MLQQINKTDGFWLSSFLTNVYPKSWVSQFWKKTGKKAPNPLPSKYYKLVIKCRQLETGSQQSQCNVCLEEKVRSALQNSQNRSPISLNWYSTTNLHQINIPSLFLHYLSLHFSTKQKESPYRAFCAFSARWQVSLEVWKDSPLPQVISASFCINNKFQHTILCTAHK